MPQHHRVIYSDINIHLTAHCTSPRHQFSWRCEQNDKKIRISNLNSNANRVNITGKKSVLQVHKIRGLEAITFYRKI